MSAELSSEQAQGLQRYGGYHASSQAKNLVFTFMRGVFIYQHSPKLFLVILHFHQHVQTLFLLHHK